MPKFALISSTGRIGFGFLHKHSKTTFAKCENYPSHSLPEVQGVKVTNERIIETTHKTCLVEVALNTEWGPVVLDLIVPSRFPETMTILLESAMIQAQGIHVDARLQLVRAWANNFVKGMNTRNIPRVGV